VLALRLECGSQHRVTETGGTVDSTPAGRPARGRPATRFIRSSRRRSHRAPSRLMMPTDPAHDARLSWVAAPARCSILATGVDQPLRVGVEQELPRPGVMPTISETWSISCARIVRIRQAASPGVADQPQSPRQRDGPLQCGREAGRDEGRGTRPPRAAPAPAPERSRIGRAPGRRTRRRGE
jgi:hypothetical protein